MKLRFLSIFAAAVLLAACESPQSGGGAAGGGTPAKPPEAAQKASGIEAGSIPDFIANVGDRVFFDYDSFAVRSDAKASLDKQVAWLKKYPKYSINVEGHCDERGTREYNLALGERRANAVKEYMVASGVPANRVTTASFGKERPVALGNNEAAWSQNRRGVTVLK